MRRDRPVHGISTAKRASDGIVYIRPPTPRITDSRRRRRDATTAKGSDCVVDNRWFCTDWVRAHWHDTLEPSLVQHVKLSLIAVAIGFAIALAAALVSHRYRLADRPFVVFSAIVYTIPSLALFQLLVPVTGLTVTTVEVALVGYTLLILYRNIIEGLRGVPTDVLEAARGMGLTRRQTLWRIELPLAVPAMIAGIRIATVSTIGLVTISFVLGLGGLGSLIYDGLTRQFRTPLVIGYAGCIALAVAADLLLLGLERLVTPWARRGAA